MLNGRITESTLCHFRTLHGTVMGSCSSSDKRLRVQKLVFEFEFCRSNFLKLIYVDLVDLISENKPTAYLLDVMSTALRLRVNFCQNTHSSWSF